VQRLFGSDPITTKVEEADVAIIFDVSNLAHRAANAHKWAKNSTGKFSGHIFGTMQSIIATLRHYSADQTAILVFALDGSKKRALKMFPGYKAGRDKKKFNPMPEVINLCHQIPGLMIINSDEEADHVIAAFVRDSALDKVVVTTDHDLWQLWGQAKIVGTKQTEITQDDLAIHYGVGAKQIAIHKAIFGDSSDSLPKLPITLRKKIILPLLHHTNSLEDLYDNADACDSLPADVYKALYKHRKQVETNYEIARLDRHVTYDQTVVGNPEQLVKLLQHHDCRTLLDGVRELFCSSES
jgi:5'-3' exonuclease